MATSILLVEDQNVVRESLRVNLEKQKDFLVVGEAASGESAVELAKILKPDVVIMDIHLPESKYNGIEATQRILEKNTHTKVLALSMRDEPAFVRRMLAAGASGYLLKDCCTKDLVNAIHLILLDKVYLSEPLREAIIDDYRNQLRRCGPAPSVKLTERETDVLIMVVEDFSIKEIAHKLNIGTKTVDTHRRNLMEKLDIYTTAGLIRYAIHEGIVSL